MNLARLVRYPVNISDLFVYFVVVVFSLFGISKKLITKAVIL